MAVLIFVLSFVLVFVCTLVALRQIEEFSNSARWLVATCSGLLSALGLISFIGDHPLLVGPDLAGIPLPYAALGATLIVLLILLLLAKLWRVVRDTPRRSRQRDDRERIARDDPEIGALHNKLKKLSHAHFDGSRSKRKGASESTE